jgi:hypothetical protein
VHHEPSISQELPNKTKPDAIYGLRHTRNIENLLNDTARIGSTQESGDVLIHEILGESPVSDEGDQISFPFLLLEAKSAKAAESDWNSILLQSAFPVRTLLSVQKSLRDITGTSSKWKAGPLVWLLMSRGEDWRVCAASLYDDGVRKPGMVGTTDYVRSPSLHSLPIRITLVVKFVHSTYNSVHFRPLGRLHHVQNRGFAALTNCGLCVRMGSRYLS